MGKPDWMKKNPQPAKKEEPTAPTVGGPKVGGPTVAQTPASPPARPSRTTRPPVSDTDIVSAPNPAAVVKEEAPTPPAEPVEQTHTVVSGDNLSVISRKYYGTADHWRKIYEANKAIIKDPNVVRIGQVLTIPTLE
jgi:nucleoid-associated protein YgaU